MIILTSHVIVYIELDFEDVVDLYHGQFIITPTGTPYTYNFFTFVVVDTSSQTAAG